MASIDMIPVMVTEPDGLRQIGWMDPDNVPPESMVKHRWLMLGKDHPLPYISNPVGAKVDYCTFKCIEIERRFHEAQIALVMTSINGDPSGIPGYSKL